MRSNTPRKALAGILITGLLSAFQAAAQPPDVVLNGTAQTGSDVRPVRFHFYCSANSGPNLTGAFSVQLEVPQVEQLSKVFDFEPFEGPGAHAGALSHLEASGARTKAQGNFTASGYYTADPPDAFMLEVSAARRPAANARLKSVAAILRPLMDAPSKLLWRQGSANAKGIPIVASLQIESADAGKLQAVLGDCLAAK